MGFYKKTIFLKNPTEKGMALLSIEKTSSGIFGTIKGYDLPSCEDMILGVSVNGKGLVKQSVFFGNENTYTFKLSNDFDIDGNIGCVLINNLPTTVKPLVWGSNNNKSCFKEDIIEIFKEEKRDKNTVIKKTTLSIENDAVEKSNDDVKNANNNTAQNIEKEVGVNVESQAHLFEDTTEEIEKLIDEEMGEGDFYSLIKDQIDDLFARFPHNADLENLVDNSKWVTISYDNVEKDYVVGLLYDEEKNLEFIAYGVPGNIENQPPSQIIEYSQWLPLDPKTPSESGYWVMFQDAVTGDSVRLRAQDIS